MTDIPLLETQIVTLTKLLADAEWDGNEPLAERLRADMMRLRTRVEQGEIYDTDF